MEGTTFPPGGSGYLFFDEFTGEGLVTDEQALVTLEPAPVDTSALSGTHENQMPLNLEVVAFE